MCKKMSVIHVHSLVHLEGHPLYSIFPYTVIGYTRRDPYFGCCRSQIENDEAFEQIEIFWLEIVHIL